MHRLFVALRPPAAVRADLIGLMEGVAGARWQDDDQLHITLRFIGEVDRHVAEDAAVALGGVDHPPVSVALDGVGTFDKRGHVNAVWAGVRPHDAITHLHRKVDQALVRAGLPPEGRAYLPHITLARFGRESAGLAAFLARHAGLASAPFAMDWFGLYESRLGAEGPSYTIVERYGLNG